MTRPEDYRRPAEVPEVDAMLRRALAPDEAVVDRLVTTALAESDTRSTPWFRWRSASRRWQVTTAAAVVVLAASMSYPGKIWIRETTPTNSARLPLQDGMPPILGEAPTLPPTPQATVSLRISNESGPVTVTTSSGSKMILLSRVSSPYTGSSAGESASGDAS